MADKIKDPRNDGPLVQHPAGIPHDDDFGKLLDAAVTEDDRDSHALRFYDQGIKDWIMQVVSINGRGIRTIQSTPMRAYSTMADLFGKEKDGKMYPKDAKPWAKFPFPFCAFDRTNVKWRSEWGNSKAPMRNLYFVNEDDKRRTAYARPPRPLDLEFQMDFYSRMEMHMRWIMQRIEEQFWPLAYMQIRTPFLNEPCHQMAMKYGGWVDNSDLEPGVEGDRIIRQTLTVTVEGWMWFDIKQAPTVHRYGQESPDLEESNTALTDLAPPLTSDDIAELPSSPDTGGVVNG